MPRELIVDDEAEIRRKHFRDDRSREAFRAEQTAKIPSWYSPLGHVLATTSVGVAALVLAVVNVRDVRWVELLTVPAVFVLANLFEWRAHKKLLHRRTPPLHELYDRHTPVHHRIYRYGDMQVRTWRELRFVLIPAIGILGIVVSAAPLAWGIGRLVNPNVGWLFLMGEAVYTVSYELTHLSYHMPSDSFVQRFALVRWLSEHHGRHHDPRLMQRWNFNVTLPLFDWVFGTTAPQALVDRIRGTAAKPSDASHAEVPLREARAEL